MTHTLTKAILIPAMFALGLIVVMTQAGAASNGAQVFNVYDNTNDGLVVADDPAVGNVEAVANPGGQYRVVFNTSLKKAAPNCTYNVELVMASDLTNGGLDETGHTGFPVVLGTLTTNKAGNGNAHFDYEVVDDGDGLLETAMYGHLDFEATELCYEDAAETDPVVSNEYGAAPDPELATPFTWMM